MADRQIQHIILLDFFVATISSHMHNSSHTAHHKCHTTHPNHITINNQSTLLSFSFHRTLTITQLILEKQSLTMSNPLFNFLARNNANKAALMKRILMQKEAEESFDTMKEQETAKAILKATREILHKDAPMLCEKEIVMISDVMNNLISAIESKFAELSVGTIDLNNNETAQPSSLKPKKKTGEGSNRHPELTWMEKAIAAFIYLHLDVYGTGINMNLLKKVSAATGANVNTVRHWFILTDKQAAANIAVWYQIAKKLTWADMKKRFPKLWTNQFAIPDGATVLKELKPFRAVALKSQTLIVTKFSNNNLSTAKGRVVAARKNSNIK